MGVGRILVKFTNWLLLLTLFVMLYYLTAGENIRSIMIETKNDVKLKQFNV